MAVFRHSHYRYFWEKCYETPAPARSARPTKGTRSAITAATAIGIRKLSMAAWLAGDDAGPDIFGKVAFAALRDIIG